MFSDIWKNLVPGEERTFDEKSIIGYRIGIIKEHYWFGLKGSFKKEDFPPVDNSLENLNLSFEQVDQNNTYLKIILNIVNDEQYLRFFHSICFEICNSTMHYHSRNISDAIENMIMLFNKWINLFSEAQSSEMSEPKQKGLFGELLFIQKLIEKNKSKDTSYIISSWIGPGNPPGEQDFKVKENLAEIKAQSSGNSSLIRINSQNQLSFSPPQVTFLVCKIIERSEKNDINGKSIFDLKSFIEKEIKDQNTFQRFFQSLIAYGYNEEHNYVKNKKWTLICSEYFQIGYDFPLINQGTLPDGIDKVQYDVIKNHESVQKYLLKENDFFEILFGEKETDDEKIIKEKLEEEVNSSNNKNLEKKRTFVYDYKNFYESGEKNKNNEISFLIVKTLCAFMNSQGGCIMIGIEDTPKKQVDKNILVGIDDEIDTFFNGSTKEYLSEINKTIKALVGETCVNLFTLKIYQIGEKKILVIRVSRSRRKVFIRNMNSLNKRKKLFFVREKGSTIELNGNKIDEYWNSRK